MIRNRNYWYYIYTNKENLVDKFVSAYLPFFNNFPKKNIFVIKIIFYYNICKFSRVALKKRTIEKRKKIGSKH